MTYTKNTGRSYTQSWLPKGFTLIELLVVVLIIGILAAIAVPQYQKMTMYQKYKLLETHTLKISDAARIYHLSNGAYPRSLGQLDITPSSSYACDTNIGWNGLIRCYDNKIQMGFFYNLSSNLCFCVAQGADINWTNTNKANMQQQICYKVIGGPSNPHSNNFGSPEYRYSCH